MPLGACQMALAFVALMFLLLYIVSPQTGAIPLPNPKVLGFRSSKFKGLFFLRTFLSPYRATPHKKNTHHSVLSLAPKSRIHDRSHALRPPGPSPTTGGLSWNVTFADSATSPTPKEVATRLSWALSSSYQMTTPYKPLCHEPSCQWLRHARHRGKLMTRSRHSQRTPPRAGPQPRPSVRQHT